MPKKTTIGVMGPGDGATERDRANAYQLGQLIASQGWVLLTGGRNVGVMEAASQGAKVAGGLTLGILGDRDSRSLSAAVDIAIFTDLGNARNNLNVLSSDVVIACGMGLGTASEVALALKNGKPVVLLTDNRESQSFFTQFGAKHLAIADTPDLAIQLTRTLLSSPSRKP